MNQISLKSFGVFGAFCGLFNSIFEPPITQNAQNVVFSLAADLR